MKLITKFTSMVECFEYNAISLVIIQYVASFNQNKVSAVDFTIVDKFIYFNIRQAIIKQAINTKAIMP